MRQDRRDGLKVVNGTGKGLLTLVCLLLALALALPGVSQGQQNQCWTLVNGVWTYNPACSLGTNAPLKVAVGKQLTVNNTLTLSGQDNASLNIGAGGTLGSAAYASVQAFQPAGGQLNLVGVDNTTQVTCNTSGTKSFTVATGLGFISNLVVSAVYTSNMSTYMLASVYSYNATTGALVLNQPTVSQGTCTNCTGWTIQISGPIGPTGQTGAGGAPVGSMELWPRSDLPINYLWCSGPSFGTGCVDKTTYSALYGYLQDTWTSHNGCTGNNFGLPDMRGVMPIGAGQGQTHEGGGTGTTRTLGTYGGAETHTQITAEVGTHNHTITDPGHHHTILALDDLYGFGGYGLYAGTGNGGNTSTATTGITVNNVNGSGANPMNIMNPFVGMNWIIRYQ